MKLFVWDFHGVLEQGTERAVMSVSNAVLENSGYSERFTIEDCQRMFGLKWHEYFEFLLPGTNRSIHLELEEASYAYSLANPGITAKVISPAPHSQEVLETIAQSEHDQIVISNTLDSGLAWFLGLVDLTRYFPNGNSFATQNPGNSKSKLELLTEYVIQQKLLGKTYDQIIGVGDSPPDVEFITQSGGRAYQYSHPWVDVRNGGTKPYKLIQDLREVLVELN
ncbi:HAD family hydrolase [Candidatus Woesearchaeota archaeon]|jgi:phosphoglycolate phosphatase-like HAD superfamily hydrolase|nr:HAD family hydrolase [Candidatus Woesearchaeota archaeon]